ncbi:MAG TPA: hypothetical protein VE644_02025, partial [Gaiellaceae bacterium]|nr:hypothetical protein [Gaiellaceae bacterium]
MAERLPAWSVVGLTPGWSGMTISLTPRTWWNRAMRTGVAVSYRGLVLVDTFGLRRLRPRPMFALTLAGFLA